MPMPMPVRKPTPQPAALSQSDAAFAAGRDAQAFRDATAITARAAFMQRLVQSFGFTLVSREAAAKHAHKPVERDQLKAHMVTYRASPERWCALVSPYHAQTPEMEHFSVVCATAP